MKFACYNSQIGELVTPEEFIHRATPRYKEKAIFPYCKECGQVVEVCGVHNPNITSYFGHPDIDDNLDPLDDCTLANRTERFKGMQPHEIDHNQASHVRSLFFDDDNLKRSYTFMLTLCGNKNLPVKSFIKCIDRADKKKVWGYKNIPLWVIPYILLTLENFQSSSSSLFMFHFFIKKPAKTFVDELWNKSDKCSLNKVYSDSGRLVVSKRHDIQNPLQFSQNIFIKMTANRNWIDKKLLSMLKTSC